MGDSCLGPSRLTSAFGPLRLGRRTALFSVVEGKCKMAPYVHASSACLVPETTPTEPLRANRTRRTLSSGRPAGGYRSRDRRGRR